MKKCLLILCMLLATFGSMAANYDAEIDGIYYNFSENEAYVVRGDLEYSGDIVIPEFVVNDGVTYKVTRIGTGRLSMPFQSCTGLTSLVIPGSVEKISGIFSGCSNLSTVTLTLNDVSCTFNANNLKSIYGLQYSALANIFGSQVKHFILAEGSLYVPSYVFSSCNELEHVDIPEGVVSIGENAFFECTALKSLYIPSTVRSIRAQNTDSKHSEHTALASIVVDENNLYYDSRNNCNAIIETQTNILQMGCKNTVIPEGVLMIEDYAFFRCEGLTSITIPNSVTYIGSCSFYLCQNLTTVNIGNGVMSIATSAFVGDKLTDIYCHAAEPPSIYYDYQGYLSSFQSKNLDNITLHVPATSIEAYMNSKWQLFKNIVPISEEVNIVFVDSAVKALCVANWDTNGDGELSMEEAASVTDLGTVFKGNKEITSFNELQYFTGLTAIEDGVFSSCSNLLSVIMPNSVETVGNSIFQNCKSLDYVYFSDKLTNIGNSMFSGCNQLLTVKIPQGVNSIGSSAFKGCRSLRNVAIPASVTSIGNDAFMDCIGLVNACYETLSGLCNIEFANIYANPLYYAHHLDIDYDSGVRRYYVENRIGEMLEITIPSDMTKIGLATFAGCTNLYKVNVYAPITTIDASAFEGCSELTFINIPERVTSIHRLAFKDCSNLINVTISSNEIAEKMSLPATFGSQVTHYTFETYQTEDALGNPYHITIGEKACNGSIALTSVTVGNGVYFIEENAFSGCTGLRNLQIGKWVTRIGSSILISENEGYYAAYTAFSGCPLERIEVDAENPIYDSRDNCNALIMHVGNDLYALVLGCKNTVIPQGIDRIGHSAFRGVKGLTSVTIPENAVIDMYAFYGCEDLVSISIPESVTTIGWAFHNTTWLESQPDGMVYIGKVAYTYKGKIDEDVELTLESDTRGIAGGAFSSQWCSHIVSINIPEGVEAIGGGAFANCSGLQSIVLPKSLKTIGEGYVGYDAFGNSRNLKDVYCLSEEVPSAVSDTFHEIASEATLHVPASAVDAYKSTEPWSSFGTIVALTDEVVGIKQIENGQLTIDNETGLWYTLDGKKQNGKPAVKGIYIERGKKLLMK